MGGYSTLVIQGGGEGIIFLLFTINGIFWEFIITTCEFNKLNNDVWRREKGGGVNHEGQFAFDTICLWS